MINGFVLEIINLSDEAEIVDLFKENGLPEKVTIRAFHTAYDYDSLLSMAKNKGFQGSGISTDYNDILHITYKNAGITEAISFHKLFTEREIILNGISKYLNLQLPPNVSIVFQLMPRVK